MHLDKEKLKEKLKELLKEKLMAISGVKTKFTVADVYQEAAKMLKDELAGMKSQPLSSAEEVKMEKLGKMLSKMVLKEMKVI